MYKKECFLQVEVCNLKVLIIFASRLRSVLADVVELVDTLDLGSSAARRGGSTPFIRTNFVKSFSF